MFTTIETTIPKIRTIVGVCSGGYEPGSIVHLLWSPESDWFMIMSHPLQRVRDKTKDVPERFEFKIDSLLIIAEEVKVLLDLTSTLSSSLLNSLTT